MVRFGKHTLMDEVINGMGLLGSIFYKHSVVGGVLQKIAVKYGARKHSARRYSRVHIHI